jgi:hypothetical protein
MTPEWMYCVWRGQREAVLYDLVKDPNQTRNVVRKYPDVACEMRGFADEHLAMQGMGDQAREYT